MDLSAVSSVLNRIGGLLTREVTSLLGVKDQVEDLQEELIWMQSFLKEADARKLSDNEVVRTSVADIRELAYDAEDIIETFALKVGSKRKGGISNVIKRSACILNEGWLLCQTKCQIEQITSRITKLRRRLQTYDVKKSGDERGSSSSNERRDSRRLYPHNNDDNVVGLDNDTKELVSVLVDEKSDCRVVSICGMGGLGKTTLAKKIYQHKQVRGHFKHLAWVYVSQQCQKRKVWEDILSSLTSSINEGGSKVSDEELAKKLFDYLKDNKCLVILDDIWSIEAWDSLKPAFPLPRDNSSGSKFLLTSRNKEVASHADRRGHLHELQCLNEKESWELFQKIAFLERDSTGIIVDVEKEKLGKGMVNHCGGLPLATIVLGGILSKRNSLHEWLMAFENVKSYLKRDKGQRTEDVLALSYDDLPPYLKPCFLYLSHFPEDYEIPAERLIQLWVAEGLFSSNQDEGNGGEIMEYVAERCLIELVERCMVQVGERDKTLEIKTCRMHDLMRDLCLTVAKRENFLCIIDDFSFSPSNTRAARRIVAHQCTPIKCIKKSFPLRSILWFGDPSDPDAISKALPCPKMLKYVEEQAAKKGCDSLWWVSIFVLIWIMHWTYLFSNFKLLRVLDFGSKCILGGWKLPSAVGNPIHLRFLSLENIFFVWPRIPSSLGNLKCLQTLDLRIVADAPSYVPDVIWKLEQLRHLYLPNYLDDKTKLKLHTLRNLLTLVNFNTNHCSVADLSKLINLRKLMICWSFNIEDFKENLDQNLPIITSKYLQSLSINGFSSIDGFSTRKIDPRHLAHLLSSCVDLCELILEVRIGKLPDFHHFSSNIAYIHLNWCDLVEDPMPTLEKLPNLRILELHEDAFTGVRMVCSAPHFRKLDSLSFTSLRNLEEWKVGEEAMPALRHLEIHGCSKLKMLPEGLRFVTTLQEVKIKRMPKAFKDKVVEGGDDFYKVQHIPCIIFQNCD